MSEDHEAWVEQDVDRVAEEVLDAIGPVLAWWRVEAARRLGLDAASLACLDLVRRHRRVSSSLIAERSGLTRSAVSKLLRRLRDAGHVELVGGGRRGQALEVVLRPHAERDAELERIHRRLRDRLRWSVGTMFDEGERATALRVLREIAGALQLTAAESVDAAAEERRARERRAARRRRAAARDDLDGSADDERAVRGVDAPEQARQPAALGVEVRGDDPLGGGDQGDLVGVRQVADQFGARSERHLEGVRER